LNYEINYKVLRRDSTKKKKSFKKGRAKGHGTEAVNAKMHACNILGGFFPVCFLFAPLIKLKPFHTLTADVIFLQMHLLCFGSIRVFFYYTHIHIN